MGASRTFVGIVDLLRTAWQESVEACVKNPDLSAAGGALGEALDVALQALQAAAPAARGGEPVRPPPAGARLAVKRSPATAGFGVDGPPRMKAACPAPPRSRFGLASPRPPAAAQQAHPTPPVRTSGAALRLAPAAPPAPPQTQPGSGSASRGGAASKDAGPAGVLPAEMLDALPQEALHDMLAQAIEGWLRRRKQCRGMPEAVGSLSHMRSSPNLMGLVAHVRPPIVSLQDWIAEHMHEDISCSEGANGEVTLRMSMTEEDQETRRASREAVQEQFFQALPEGAFTEEEIALRDALICFLQSWTKVEPPLLSTLSQPGCAETNAVAFAKAMLLPRHVQLRQWIMLRIGGDVEMVDRPGGGTEVRLAAGA